MSGAKPGKPGNPGKLEPNRLARFQGGQVLGSPPPYVPPGPPTVSPTVAKNYRTQLNENPSVRSLEMSHVGPSGGGTNAAIQAAIELQWVKRAEKNSGTVPGVPGLVPQGSPEPRPKSIDELINAGFFQSCLNVLGTDADTYTPYDTVMLNQALLFFPKIPKGHIKKTSLELIKSILTERQPQNNLGTLQERRNALMLWPEAWNAMSVDQFVDGIFALIGPETASNKDAYAYIRKKLNEAIDTSPVCTLRDVINALNLNKDRDQDSYMGIPLDTYIHLKKIMVKHTLIYNISPLQNVVDTFNRLHGDPNLKHNTATVPTINGAIVQTILFGIYDVHDPDHVVKENGILVGFAPTFSNLWRSKQQVKAQVYLSGKTVEISLSGIKDYETYEKTDIGLHGHEDEFVDLYGNFRKEDPRYMMTWGNPEPRIVPIFSKLAKKYKEPNDKRLKLLNDTLDVIWDAPGPETPTFIHMFTDNEDFRRAFGIHRLGPIRGNQGYVEGGGFNITNPGINPYPGHSRETITGTAVTGQLGQLVARSSFDGTPLGPSTIEPIPLQAYINMQRKGKGGMRSKTRKGKGRRRGRTRKSKK